MPTPPLPLRVNAPSRAPLFVAAMAAFALVMVAIAVRTGSGLVQWDTAIGMWFATNSSSLGTRAMTIVSLLNNEIAIGVYGMALAWWLFATRRYFWSLVAFCAIPSGMLLNFAIKHVFTRPRPSFGLVQQTFSGYSFPSGHTSGAMLVYGVLICALLSGTPTPTRRLAAAACAAMILLVGFSRVYLGAHYFSDVIAAGLEGICWLALVIAWRGSRTRAHQAARPRLGATLMNWR
ncbi:phosphatase PAP2 family protein [Variovorax robiniae]|uniref:Phosphatase PAP2 family protein n=1 Tax=Variovorax robiniae TaxID=1836199 RepID=A0ABU8X3Q1_9BURK